MLHFGAVRPELLQVLRQLMGLSELVEFQLAGGTALALYYGHRKSVDIDLFSAVPFDNQLLADTLKENIEGFSYRSTLNPIGLFCYINDVKIDFIKHHHHPLIKEPQLVEGIRLTHPEEIMAMKVAAILKRGVKKDFWDIAELFNHYSLESCINAYTKKYADQMLLISIPYALSWFDDAEESEEPISLKGQTWSGIKKQIKDKVNEYLR